MRSATEEYIARLAELKPGTLSLLRAHAGQRLDESVDGFDLFAGLWWPLRQQSKRAPRRAVAWLVAKLYACRPIQHEPGAELAWQLGRCRPPDERARTAHQQRFDRMLNLPLSRLEPPLRWALNRISACNLNLDWVRLTDDLSIWERESTRLRWAKQFVETTERSQPC